MKRVISLLNMRTTRWKHRAQRSSIGRFTRVLLVGQADHTVLQHLAGKFVIYWLRWWVPQNNNIAGARKPTCVLYYWKGETLFSTKIILPGLIPRIQTIFRRWCYVLVFFKYLQRNCLDLLPNRLLAARHDEYRPTWYHKYASWAAARTRQPSALMYVVTSVTPPVDIERQVSSLLIILLLTRTQLTNARARPQYDVIVLRCRSWIRASFM